MNPFERTKWISLYNKNIYKITGLLPNGKITINDPIAQYMTIEYFYHTFINKDCWVNKNLYQKYLKDVVVFTLLNDGEDMDLNNNKYKEFRKFIFRIFQTKPLS